MKSRRDLIQSDPIKVNPGVMLSSLQLLSRNIAKLFLSNIFFKKARVKALKFC